MNRIYYEKPKHLQNSSENEISSKAEKNYSSSNPRNSYISSSQPKKKSTKGLNTKIVNIILIILSILFVFLVIVAIDEVSSFDREWTRDKDDFWYYISDGRYSYVVDMYYNNQYANVETTLELEECYAVAKYFEAASLYKVAVQTGNMEDMNKYSVIMEENLQYMEEFLYVAEDINAKLGIE